MIIKLVNIKKKYRNNVYVLNNLNCSIKNNKIFGMVGPNGAGKSTLLNIIAGMTKMDSGEIYLFDNKISEKEYSYKINLGFMLENNLLFEKLSIQENLNFVGLMYNVEATVYKERYLELLTLLEINENIHQSFENLSNGQQKKILFVAAISHKPKLLFLDEPFENVDPISRKKMKDVLKKMRENGATVFITSHALAEVEDFCDEVAIINKGKIVYQSETKDIRSKIKDEITKETYQSLEEIFLDLTQQNQIEDKTLSWL